jgi:hypothetical protein
VSALAELASPAAPSPAPEPTEAHRALQLRECWRRGDWSTLDQVPDGELELHPDRARLLVLRAAARLALGQRLPTRRDADAARRAGCDPVLLRRALVASVHNSLARAAAANPSLRGRAAHHFRESLAPAGAHPLHARWVEARIHQQLSDAQLPTDAAAVAAASVAVPDAGPAPWKPLQDALQHAQTTATAQIRALGDQVSSLQRGLDSTVRKEIANAVAQVEAHANLQSYLSGQPTVPRLHGWPVSPDFGMLMVDLIESNDYDAVIEFGSGASTVLIAHALKRLNARRPVPVQQLSFDHLPQYFEQTAGMLAGVGLDNGVRLCLAPLAPLALANGDARPCYTGTAALDALARDLTVPGGRAPRLLIVVDGPPGTTGPKARYPVLELVHRSFPQFSGQVLLDDYARPDERAVAADWCAYLAAHRIDHHLREYELEKAACVITLVAGRATPEA